MTGKKMAKGANLPGDNVTDRDDRSPRAGVDLSCADLWAKMIEHLTISVDLLAERPRLCEGAERRMPFPPKIGCASRRIELAP